jgi:hypothetical protein
MGDPRCTRLSPLPTENVPTAWPFHTQFTTARAGRCYAANQRRSRRGCDMSGRRARFGGALACAAAALALAPGSAAAAQWDWAIDGSPVPAGKRVAVSFATTGVLTIAVPALELTVTCEVVSGTGHLTGGQTGGGSIKTPDERCAFRKDHMEPNSCRVKLVDGELSVAETAGAGPPDEVKVNVKELRMKGRFSGGKAQETLKGEGAVWALGPLAEENRFVFGAANEASSLTVNGQPATVETQVRFIVKNDPAAVIGFAMLP